MTWSKFISNLWYFNCSHLNLNKALISIISSQNDLVDVTFFRMLEWDRHIFVRFNFSLLITLNSITVILFKYIIFTWGNNFSNYNIITTNLSSRWNYSIFIKFIISTMLHSTCFSYLGSTDFIFITLGLLISSIKNTTEKTTINSRLIQHNWIFLVVSTIASNCNNTITTCRKFFESQVFHTSRCY